MLASNHMSQHVSRKRSFHLTQSSSSEDDLLQHESIVMAVLSVLLTHTVTDIDDFDDSFDTVEPGYNELYRRNSSIYP